MVGNKDHLLAPKRFTLPSIGARVAELTRDVYRRRGFAEAHILANWPQIVGEDMAEFSAPERLKFPRKAPDTRGPQGGATLAVRVDGPIALEIRHLEPQIIERINSYYGYQAVVKLKLVQGPLPERRKPRKRSLRQLDPEERNALGKSLRPIAEPGLKGALERLGERILGRSTPNRP